MQVFYRFKENLVTCSGVIGPRYVVITAAFVNQGIRMIQGSTDKGDTKTVFQVPVDLNGRIAYPETATCSKNNLKIN